jgi:histidinol-phosphate aminotransferase
MHYSVPSSGLTVTRTFSKAFSLAACRVGYAMANKELIEQLDTDNDAYTLARTTEAAAMASLEHLKKIQKRISSLKALSNEFAKPLHNLGIKTYPTETYYFLGRTSNWKKRD